MESRAAKPLPRPTRGARGSYERKRRKTRSSLLGAAKRVMAAKGVEAATISEIAEAADVAPGTFYNYFRTREEILEAIAADLVDEFRAVMAAIQAAVRDPAERLSVAVRLFLDRVRADPLWGWFMARFGPTLPILRDQTRRMIREGIVATGLRRGRFRLESTRAIGDLITGTSVTSLRSILEGRSSPDVAPEVAELLLRALGVPLDEAREISRRPLPRLELAPRSRTAADGAERRLAWVR